MLPRVGVVKKTLPNGLRVVTVEVPHLHTATLVTYAKVGSRYETRRDNGLSHFLEHMLFRGTNRYPSSFALNYAIESLGGTLYAETGRDYSLYQISLDPRLITEGISLFGEILGAPAFTQLEVERQIVLEEIHEDLDEDGRDINLDDLARRTAFPAHPLGQKITGPLTNVERFGEADVRRHFARFYGARNLVFCVSGPVRAKEVLAAARRSLGSLPSGRPAPSRRPADFRHGPRFAYVDSPGAQSAVQVLFRALPEGHPEYVALQALSRVLDDGMSTRLHYRLADQAGLAYYVNAAIEPFHDTAQFEIDGAAQHAKFADLVQGILGLVDELCRDLCQPEELAKAKRRYRLELESAFDDVDALAGWFGGTELFYEPPTYEEKVQRMERVTAEDIRRVARRVFRPERLVVAAAGGLSAAQKRRVERVIRDWRRPRRLLLARTARAR